MGSAVAMMISGTVVNVLAFTGGNFLYFRNSAKAKERHDKAVEQLGVAQTAWSKQRMQLLDFINEEIKKASCSADF